MSIVTETSERWARSEAARGQFRALVRRVCSVGLQPARGRATVVGQNRSLSHPCKFTTGAKLVFLAITPVGLKDALREATSSGTAVWCGADVVYEQDFATRKAKGLTRFA